MMWLLRAVRWVRNPPPGAQARFVILIVVAVIVLGTIDWMGWWPEWATVNPRHPRMLRP